MKTVCHFCHEVDLKPGFSPFSAKISYISFFYFRIPNSQHLRWNRHPKLQMDHSLTKLLVALAHLVGVLNKVQKPYLPGTNKIHMQYEWSLMPSVKNLLMSWTGENLFIDSVLTSFYTLHLCFLHST